MSDLTAELAIRCTQIIGAVGVIIGGLETIVSRRDFETRGLLDWQVLRTDSFFTFSTLPAIASRILDGTRIVVIAGALSVVGGAVLLFAHPDLVHARLATIAVFVGLMIVNFRCPFGLDGSDQMYAVVFGTLAIRAICPSPEQVSTIALWFLALQACLAYFTAGFAKLISPTWRSGNAVILILNTRNYSFPRVSALLLDYPKIGLVGAWGVIVFETLFPLTLLGVESILLCFLVAGVAFHLFNAAIMGLNSFLCAFVATYPAVIFSSLQFRGALLDALAPGS